MLEEETAQTNERITKFLNSMIERNERKRVLKTHVTRHDSIVR